MPSRSYSWPAGHWDWYRHLAFKHGVRCGRMIFVGGQVDKDANGVPLHIDDLAAQTAHVVRHIQSVLAEFGASLADVTRLVAFYATDGDVDESSFVADVGRHVIDLGGAPDGVGPTIVPVPLPWLALPGMRVEIEAVAMLGEDGTRLAREASSVRNLPQLPAPFQHGLRVDEHVFVGAQASRAGASDAMAALAHVLDALSADAGDLVRIGAWHGASIPGDLWSSLDALDVASVVLPSPRLPAGQHVRIDGWAMRERGQPAMTRTHSIETADWRWPGRVAHTQSVSCGDMVFVSAQLPLDLDGAALHSGDLPAQTTLCMERVAAALANAGLELDHMVKQTSFYLGAADPNDIVANQTQRSARYTEPAGASTGVPLEDFGVPGAMVSIDTIAMR